VCGYVCIGCGACGKPKSKLFALPPICVRCGAEKASVTAPCPQCGAISAPGGAITASNQAKSA